MELTGNVAGMLRLLGGGSDVEITQLLSEGVAIAIVKVDDDTITLYAPEGGGSDVEVTPALLSGTKIADIKIDDNTTALYAPAPTSVNVSRVLTEGTKIATIVVNGVSTDIYAPGGIDYSGDEQIDGSWFGETRYRKTFNISVAPPFSYIDVSSLNINQLLNFEGVGMASNNDAIMIPYCVPSGNQYLVLSYVKNENRIYISISDSLADYDNVYITIRYTKNS